MTFLPPEPPYAIRFACARTERFSYSRICGAVARGGTRRWGGVVLWRCDEGAWDAIFEREARGGAFGDGWAEGCGIAARRSTLLRGCW